MPEYINKEKLLEELKLTFCKDCHQYKDIHCRSCYIDDVLLEIEDIPTEDVVPVVRCKDCKHLEIDKGWREGRACLRKDPVDTHFCQDNDYCNYGEKKTK